MLSKVARAKIVSDLFDNKGINKEVADAIDEGFDNSFRSIDTSTSETIDISEVELIRQTTSGITTSFTGITNGRKITVKNVSNGDNIINAIIDTEVDPEICSLESFVIVFNGTDWNLI